MAPALQARHASPVRSERRSRLQLPALLGLLALILPARSAVERPRSRRQALAKRRAEFQRDENGFLSLNMTLIGGFVSFMIIMGLLAIFAPKIFDSTADVNAALKDPNATTGDEDADSIKLAFPFIIGIVVVIAIVGIILVAAKFKK